MVDDNSRLADLFLKSHFLPEWESPRCGPDFAVDRFQRQIKSRGIGASAAIIAGANVEAGEEELLIALAHHPSRHDDGKIAADVQWRQQEQSEGGE